MTESARAAGPSPEEAHPRYRRCAVRRWQDGVAVDAIDQVAEEVPVAMVYNGISHAVMLATPASLESFGLGFSLTEGILSHRSELYDLEVIPGCDGIEVRMTIPQERFAELKQRRRNLAGRTGCGLCGTESLDQAVRRPPPVAAQMRVEAAAIKRAFDQLPPSQALQLATGCTHAAGWASVDGTLCWVEEDVGRHNALDKLIGTLAMRGATASEGFALVTSRASYEMVQKTAMAGIPILLAVSAPTGLAIDMATEAGLTLVGFARSHGHVIYSHPQRLI